MTNQTSNFRDLFEAVKPIILKRKLENKNRKTRNTVWRPFLGF